jgi:hypothetical protein
MWIDFQIVRRDCCNPFRVVCALAPFTQGSASRNPGLSDAIPLGLKKDGTDKNEMRDVRKLFHFEVACRPRLDYFSTQMS